MPSNPQTRLRRLRTEIKQLALKNDPRIRLAVKGSDSAAQFARSINRLLDRAAARSNLLGKAAECFHQTFWILDVKTRRITYLNGAEDLPLDARAWVKAAHPKDRRAVATMLDKQCQGSCGQAEFRMLGPDNTIRWMWCRFFPAAASRSRITKIFAVIEDVTDQKEAEHILITSRHELHDLAEERRSRKFQSIGELMGGIAHEINTPVQFVGDNMRFLRDALPKMEALLRAASPQGGANPDIKFLRQELARALKQAEKGVDRIARIAKNMKEFSREQKTPGNKSVNLNQAMDSTLLIARNALKYVADVQTIYGILPLVTCHQGNIQQVFLDLLIHAAAAIREVADSTGKRGMVTVETKPAGDWVTISISDTGSPLSQEAGHELFETSSSSEKHGLAVAHSIVTEEHAGTVTLFSEPGKGNTFSVRLPVLGKSRSAAAAAGSS